MPSDIGRLSVSAATHKGYARSGNEDSFLVDHRIGGGDLDQLTVELMVATNAVVLAIADGLGGHKAGEVASRYAVAQISASCGEVDFSDDSSVSELLNSISRGLHHEMLETPAFSGMGTTIVIAVVTAQSLTFVNVGDSRGYVIDESGVHQTTYDDVPPKSSTASRRTGAITQALGGIPTRTRVIPHIHRSSLPKGDWSLVLCSDGVTDFLSSHEIASIGRSGNADAMTLVNSALHAGGEDNISAIVARYSQPRHTNGPADQ